MGLALERANMVEIWGRERPEFRYAEFSSLREQCGGYYGRLKPEAWGPTGLAAWPRLLAEQGRRPLKWVATLGYYRSPDTIRIGTLFAPLEVLSTELRYQSLLRRGTIYFRYDTYRRLLR